MNEEMTILWSIIIFFFFQTVCLADANEGFWIAKLDKKNNLHSSEKDLKHIYLYENFANVLIR